MTDLNNLCSTCQFYSQVSLYHYIQKLVLFKFELTFVDLRYFLEDYRPSQTNFLKMSSNIRFSFILK